MSELLKNNINTYADTATYNADLNKDFPNISYIQGTDEVKMYKYDPEHIVAVYNVTSTESATKLLNSNSNITYQIIDGVQQQSVQKNYTFDTLGEHIVKYKLSGTSIADRTFQRVNDLLSITIPNNVTYFGNAMFENGDTSPQGGVKHIVIGSGLATIDYSSSSSTYGLLGTSATRRCESIKVDNNNTTYDSRNNCNALIETATNTLLVGCNTTVIPNSVTSIYESAFQNCVLMTNITIPNSVTSIGKRAFQKCTNLTSLTIGNGVTSIGYASFSDCWNLTSITIPSGVTSIGDSAFAINNRYNRDSITILATTPPTLGSDVFYTLSNRYPIYVPAESVDTYKAATNWSNYADRIQAIPSV